MRRRQGFTLIELMVVIAILGVLIASAYPTYKTFRARAVGSEAIVIMKQLLDAQIIYFLEHNAYFPNGPAIAITHVTPANHPDVDVVRQTLKVTLPVGHFLDFTISSCPPGILGCPSVMVIVASTASNPVPIFKGGGTTLVGMIDSEGKVNQFTL
jgi:prepilin-type N-terminal cleavage/methylation domain-containing protein